MAFKTFINNYILKEDASASLRLCNLFEEIPELREDIIVPAYADIDVGGFRIATCCIGATGTIKTLHRDIHHGLLAQSVGKSYIRIYAAEETSRLYPHQNPFLRNVSQITDIENVDESKYPLFSSADYLECILSPSEMIYMPSNSWYMTKALSL